MGLHGKYRRVVTLLKNWAVICLVLAGPVDALAQASDRQLSEELRQRRVERETRLDPYWDGFILKYEGNCEAATAKLYPIAALGLGYEEAQTALGECLLTLAGMPENRAAPPARDMIFTKDNFQTGLKWILTAAQSGGFKAQGVLIALYAADLGPDRDPVEAAKWAHLYLTNPTRLNLGAPVLAQGAIGALESRLDRETWLAGKERARIWTPVFPSAAKKPQTSAKKNP